MSYPNRLQLGAMANREVCSCEKTGIFKERLARGVLAHDPEGVGLDELVDLSVEGEVFDNADVDKVRRSLVEQILGMAGEGELSVPDFYKVYFEGKK